MAGYIKLNRSIFDDEMYFSEKFTRAQAWIDLLLLANYHASMLTIRGNRVEIPRGSLAWPIEKLAARWKWSRGKALRYIKELQKQGKIVQQKSYIITTLSVVKYEYYQADGTADGTAENATNIAEKNAENGTAENLCNSLNISNKQKGYQTNSTADGTAERALHGTGGSTAENAINGTAENATNGTAENLCNSLNISNKQKGCQINSTAENATNGTAENATNGTADGTHTKKVNNIYKPNKVYVKNSFEYQNVVDLYHQLCPAFPKLLKLTNDRKAKIRARMSEIKDLATLAKIFKKMQGSAFLRGDNSHMWRANFDWIMANDKNWVKVLEGNYDKSAPSVSAASATRNNNLPPVYSDKEVWGRK
jgi:hypothetical protein